MAYQIWNRRYTGSKYKLASWISELISENCIGKSFCDIFAGTAIMSKQMLEQVDEIYINDFLYSNEVIYKAFFEQQSFNLEKLEKIKNYFKNMSVSTLPSNYVSENYGGKFFSNDDSLIIGFIREYIENAKDLNNKEKNILLASLLYSADKAANTVGHYDAYIKGKDIPDTFSFELISPYEYNDKTIHIYRKDANQLAKEICCDIVYIDPPYNSRQYSRFYHVYETLIKWDKPELFGVARKPAPENMSDYCSSKAVDAFRDLIEHLNAKYIVVSYNNTYNSRSKSSQNKITLGQIQHILESKGETHILTQKYNAFNAGKTDLANHMEYLFVTKIH